MTVKIVQGLLGNNSGYREIRPGTAQTKQTQIQSPNQLAQQGALLGGQGRALSDAVVSSVRGNRSASLSSDKIREYREAREVTGEVAEKIRDSDDTGQSHKGLDRAGGEHFNN